MSEWFDRLQMEPPFRIAARALRRLRPPRSIEQCVLWEVSARPAYLLGVWQGAQLARAEGVDAISVMEFGVAGGRGLLALERDAARVEAATGVRIEVFGFDNGAAGLPDFIGDYRDHPETWRPGDFPMDEEALKSRLGERTRLVLGPLDETLPAFRAGDYPRVGFVSFDLDLYSSTTTALELFSGAERRMLRHVPVYFDDIEFVTHHRFAGVLLAIDEFNEKQMEVKLDRWHGVREGRPFPERSYYDKLYVAHDLGAISAATLDRGVRKLSLDEG